MADAALPGGSGFTDRVGAPAVDSAVVRHIRRGLLRTAAFVAAFCAVPGLAALLD